MKLSIPTGPALPGPAESPTSPELLFALVPFPPRFGGSSSRLGDADRPKLELGGLGLGGLGLPRVGWGIAR